MSATIELIGVRKRFGETLAIDLPEFLVPERTVLALIGPSGLRKEHPSPARGGPPPAGPGAHPGRRHAHGPATRDEILPRIGYVIQDGGLFPHLTALENTALVAARIAAGPGSASTHGSGSSSS
jgi:osmoprotectant transport system ATP-binding protein